jgi:hypothetical protein
MEGLQVGHRELVSVGIAVVIVLWVTWHRFGRTWGAPE